MINRPVQQEIKRNGQFPGKKNPVLLQEEEEMYPNILMTMMAKMHKQMTSMIKRRTWLLQ